MKGYELYGMVCGILSYGVVTGSVADNGTSPPRQLRIEQKGKRRGRNETLDGKNKAAALPSGFVSSIDPRNTHTNPPPDVRFLCKIHDDVQYKEAVYFHLISVL